jgi:hypothetical protein
MLGAHLLGEALGLGRSGPITIKPLAELMQALENELGTDRLA